MSTSNHAVAGITAPPEVELLGGFGLTRPARGRVQLPHQAQRVVAVIALTGVGARPFVAGTLWPDADEVRAHASLRTAVWQIQRVGGVLSARGGELALSEDIRIDVVALRNCAISVLDGQRVGGDGVMLLRDSPELLPGWYDDWVIAERERLTQLRLSALERLAAQRMSLGRYDDALSLALAAVSTEPLLDSAHRLVVQAHLAKGNAAAALQHFERYARILRDELGLAASPQFHAMLDPLLAARRAARGPARKGRP